MKKFFAFLLFPLVMLGTMPAQALTVNADGTGFVKLIEGIYPVLTPAEQASITPASLVAFAQKKMQSWDVVCQSATMRETSTVVVTDVTNYSYSVRIDDNGRGAPVWRGYNLTGIASTASYGTLPAVGSSCHTSDAMPGAITKVQRTNGRDATSGSGIYFTYNAIERPLQLTN